jgi:hypothetical protein
MTDKKKLLLIPAIIILLGSLAFVLWNSKSEVRSNRGGAENLLEQYSVYAEEKESYSLNESSESEDIISMEEFVILNFKTGEEKRFDLLEDLAHPKIKLFVSVISERNKFYLRSTYLGLTDGKSKFLGMIELYPSADSPAAIKTVYFKITPNTWSIEKLENLD